MLRPGMGIGLETATGVVGVIGKWAPDKLGLRWLEKGNLEVADAEGVCSAVESVTGELAVGEGDRRRGKADVRNDRERPGRFTLKGVVGVETYKVGRGEKEMGD